MTVPSVPEFLLSLETLDCLVQILLEKDSLRRSLKVRQAGPRVTGEKEAEFLLSKVIHCTREVLNLETVPPVPRLVLTKRLSRLPRDTLKAYLFFAPFSLLLLFVVSNLLLTASAMIPLAGASGFLLVVPFLIHRRTRIHIEHQCAYGLDQEGRPLILIDQLPPAQFQSYLAHEYAHHLYTFFWHEGKESWRKEGWARLTQWRVCQSLSDREKNPAYLYHALRQITGELKFACQIIASALQKRLPGKAARVPSIYHRNPLFTLLAGTPVSNATTLLGHSIGTAIYFLMEKRRGFESDLLREQKDVLFGDSMQCGPAGGS